jgi:predicted PurR-regulated permease PerM
MVQQQRKQDQIAFFVLFGLIGILVFWLIRSYLDTIALSLMMVIVLKPIYDRLLVLVRGRAGLATTLTVGVFCLIVIIPLWFTGRMIASQLNAMIASLQGSGSTTSLVDGINQTLERFFGVQTQITPAVQEQVRQIVTNAASRLASVVLGLGTQLSDLLARLLLFLAIVGAVLPNYAAIVRRLIGLSPLDDALDRLFLRKIKLTVRGMFLGIFVIALAQGAFSGLFFYLAGVPYVLLWTLLALVAALLPLGAGLVALPIAVVELAYGQYGAGLIILAGYLLIVSNLDGVLRSRLVPKEAEMSFALVLLSALGGLELFGFFGVVYGPVLMVVFQTAIGVYEEYYAREATVYETATKGN